MTTDDFAASSSACSPRRRLAWRLPALAAVAGVWATVPAWTGPELAVARRVEIVDHMVPGFAVVLAAVVGVVLGMAVLRADASSRGYHAALLLASFTAALAGLWMVATHLPLVAQATRDEVDAAAVAFHAAPGVAVAALGAVWFVQCWSATTPR